MKISFLKLFIATLIVGMASPIFAQINDRYLSVQFGYNARNLNSKPFNYAIEQYNALNDLSVKLEPVKWASGLSAGIGYHRGRSNFRLNAALFASDSYSIGPDSLGTGNLRRDVSLNGAVISVSMISELIQMYRDGHFLVGAAINFANFNAETATIAEDMYERDTPLNDVSNVWKTSFTILAPFRFGITPQFKISLEPYYQIYFSQLDFRDFNTAINGSAVPSDSPQLGAEPDHFGVNLTLMIQLRRE